VKAALKELNQQAAKLMAKGDYAGAGQLAERGRTMNTFEEKVELLRDEWRALWKARTEDAGKGPKTPLWEYYQFVLQGLDGLGGEAARRELEQHLESQTAARLKAADLKPADRRGTPRWKVMVRRARRQMIREKYLEDGAGKQWRITPLGRQVAQGSLKAPDQR
jgi:hypothetical protein